ncbi:YdcF family protein [Photobacterium sp. R1]
MSFLLLSVLLLLTIFLSFRKWKKTASVLSFLLAAITLLIGTGIIPKFLLENLQVKYQEKPQVHWASKNAIVLLGAGTEKIETLTSIEPTFFAYSRISETASQYKSCEASQQICNVIISGGDAQKNGRSEAAVYQDALLKLGVPAADIVVEPDSMNTWKNAEFTSQIIRMNHFDHVVLVSSGLHMRRSELYFKHFGVLVTPVRADYMAARPTWIPNWYNFVMTDFALHEYIGHLRYDFYNFMGWNIQRQNPGDA